MGIVTADLSVSADGYAAGVNQSLDKPFGEGLAAGLIDELRLHIVPITVGAGERIFEGVGGLTLEPRSVRGTDHVLHVTYGASR